ncbi:type II toxin-antitoxin system RelE family toxin [Methanosphaerula palustris]|uniref:type II toxin-antitoxin system RelE family toxin n=1 Tax=Methanosphaerula palustris TaxID=475088 RepID=UPI0009FED31A
MEYTDRAKKDLQKIERADAQRIIRALGRVKEDPRGSIKKLKTSAPEAPVSSIHAGGFRVLLEIVDDRFLVLVIEVTPPKDLISGLLVPT